MSTFTLKECRYIDGIVIYVNSLLESDPLWAQYPELGIEHLHSKGDPKTFGLEGLSDTLQQYSRVTYLQLVGYVGLEDQDFLRFCLLLKEHLPSVTSLCSSSYTGAVDSRTARVLECFPNLVELELGSILNVSGGALTFQAIGGLKQLENILFNPAHGLSWVSTPVCCEILANSLEGLPLLRRIEITDWNFREPRECWWPLVCALGGKPNLRVDIDREGREYIGDGSPRHPGSSNEYVIDDEQWNILQNGPTWEQKLMEVQRRYNLILPGGQDLHSFVEDQEAEIPQDLVDTWMEVLDSLFHRHNHCFYAMMNKVEIIPQRQVNRWKEQLFVLHQDPNQFGCFYTIFAKLPMEMWHASLSGTPPTTTSSFPQESLAACAGETLARDGKEL